MRRRRITLSALSVCFLAIVGIGTNAMAAEAAASPLSRANDIYCC